MSSRALRKLQQQQELEAEKARSKIQDEQKDEDRDEPDDGDSEQNNYPVLSTGSNLGARAKMPPHRNPFDLVCTLGSHNSDNLHFLT